VLDVVKYPVLGPEVLQLEHKVPLVQTRQLEGHATQMIPEG